MVNEQVLAQIDGLQAQINDAIVAGNKDVAAQLAEKLATIARQEEARCYVVNLTAQNHYLPRSYGQVTVFGAGNETNPLYRKGEKYSVTEIEGRSEIMDVLKGIKTVSYRARTDLMPRDPMAIEVKVVNGIRVEHPPLIIARDVVQAINTDLPFATEAKIRYHAEASAGVFLSADKIPSDAEIEAEAKRFEDYMRVLVAMGTEQWKRKPDSREIWDCQRKACQYLGVSTEWFNLPEKNEICPGCGERIRPNVAVCRACGAVLDAEKALALGMIAEAPGAQQKEKPRKNA
jgi:hypothetical protein